MIFQQGYNTIIFIIEFQYGYDFRWASNYSDGGRLQSSEASDEELRLFFNSEFTTNHHDYAMALTGYVFYLYISIILLFSFDLYISLRKKT